MYQLQIEINKKIRNKSQPITGLNEIEGSQFPSVSSVYLESGVEKKKQNTTGLRMARIAINPSNPMRRH